MSKALTLARLTAREVLDQPLTRIAVGVACLLLLLATFLPSFTLEPEGDLKFMSDVGLAAVAMCLGVIGLWPAATFLADELSQRTAMTLLAKPLSRRDYLLGRYLGILAALLVAAALLAVAFLFAVWLTEGEVVSSRLDRFLEELRYGPVPETPSRGLPGIRWNLGGGVLLGLSQAGVLCAVAVAFSTRLGTLPNLACSVAVFLAGHLVGPLAQSLGSGWAGWGLRALIPDFEFFDMSESVARGIPVPMGYVASCAGYAALYAGAVLAVAVSLFDRREIA